MAIRQPPTSFKDPNQRAFLQELRNAIKSVTEQVASIKPRVINVTNGGDDGGGGGGTGPTQATVVLTASPPNPVPGTEFTLTATVSGNNPTGNLTFSLDGTALSTVTLSNGVATLAQTKSAGDYSYTAAYAGDANNRSATATLEVKVGTGGGDADGEAPPAPLTLTAYPEAWAIRLVWTQPTLPADYLTTEIWCRTTASGAKTKVGEISGTTFTFTGLGNDLLQTDDTYYFWVRNRDTENLTSDYTPDDDVGVEGHCLASPDDLIDDLIGDITNGTLYNYLGEKIKLLQGPAGIPNSVQARLADQRNELVQMISEVTVSGNGTIDPYEIWHFDSTVQGWTGSSVTVSASSGALVATATANNGILWSPVLATPFLGSAYHTIRVRFKQVVGTGWLGIVKYKDINNNVYTYTPTGPQGLYTDYADFDWDLGNETDWTGNTIKQIGFVLDLDNDRLNFDWITVGRLAPGASYAQVEAIRVRSDTKTRVFYQNTPPASPYTDGYAIIDNDLWFDTNDGNKPYRWNGSATNTIVPVGHEARGTHWFETTDTRLAESWAEIYDIRNATANPSGAAAQRINGIAANAANNTAAIATEQSVRASADAALAQQITQISAGANVASRVFIGSTQPTNPIDGYTLRVNDLWYDTSVANKVTLKYWTGSTWAVRRSDTKVYYQTSAPSGDLLIGDLWYDTDDNNTPYVWIGSAWTKVLEGYINGLADAKITTFEQTKVGYATVNTGFTYGGATYSAGEVFDNGGLIFNKATVDAWNAANPSRLITWNVGLPLAKAVKQVGIRTVDGQSTTIEEQATAIYGPSGLRSQWTVKLDYNGYVSGFGLASEAPPSGTPRSEFGVRADRFFVASPNTPDGGLKNLTTLTVETYPIVLAKRTKTVNNVTTYWGYCVPESLPSGFAAGNWVLFQRVVNSSGLESGVRWNGSFRVDHIGARADGFENDTVNWPGANTSRTLFFTFTSSQYSSLIDGRTFSASDSTTRSVARFDSLPFIIQTTAQVIDGVTVPTGVYMNDAFIRRATITEAMIGNAAITNAKIGNFICSPNFESSGGNPLNPVGTPGTDGWCINKNGDAVFNRVIARTKNIEANAVSEILSGGNYALINPVWNTPIDLTQTLAANTYRGSVILQWVISVAVEYVDQIGVGMEVLRNGVKLGGNNAFFYGKGGCTFYWVDTGAGAGAVTYTFRLRWYPLTLPYPTNFGRSFFVSAIDMRR